jgi:hypothetical protein
MLQLFEMLCNKIKSVEFVSIIFFLCKLQTGVKEDHKNLKRRIII